MAITFTYPIVAPKIDDLVLGTQTPDPLSSETDTPTRNFTIQSIVDLAAAGGNTGISLLTVGTSGVSTLTAGVLNIPNYAADPSIVTIEGSQTINGAKTFTTNIAAPNVGGDNTGDQSLSITGRVITISGTNSAVTVPEGVVTSLSTTGTTGASTLIAGVLNVPNYADANTEYSLTTTGASGSAATLTGTVFDIPTPVIPTVPFTSLSVTGTTGDATLIAGVLNVPNYTVDTSGFLLLTGGEMTGAITSATAANLIVQPGTSTLEVQGDGVSVAGSIMLNCHANTHGQTIESQPHNEAITNTMLLPKGANSTLVSEATETGVTAAYSATAASTGSPLTPSIAGRNLTLTSNSYQGGANVGYVPTGGSATTFLRGDGTWVTPAGGGGGTGTVTSVDLSTDIAAFIVAANPITSAGTITLNLNGGTAGQFLRQDGTWATAPSGLTLGTTSTTALAGNTTVISNAQATAITTNSGKTSFPGFGTTVGTALEGNTALLAIGTTSTTALAGNTSLLGLGTTSTTALAGNTALLQLGTTAGTALEGNTSLLQLGTSSTTALAGNTALLQLGATSTTALAGDTTVITTTQATAITDSVKNDTDTYTTTPLVTKIITLTDGEYTAITTPNVNTLYIII